MSNKYQQISEIIEVPTEIRRRKLKDESYPNLFLGRLIKSKKIVVLSPHLDDAVLSMGSLITYLLSIDVKVEVITFFTDCSKASSKSIKTILNRANFTDAGKYFQARRNEDIIALRLLGQKVTIKHLGFQDAAWRTDDGLPLYPDTQLTEISPKDRLLKRKVSVKMEELIKNSENIVVFAPLARGKHVDHQLIRNIAAEISPQVVFYEDFPYSALYGEEEKFIQGRRLKAVEWRGEYEVKKRAILKYETQKVSLFLHGSLKLPYEKYFISEKYP